MQDELAEVLDKLLLLLDDVNNEYNESTNAEFIESVRRVIGDDVAEAYEEWLGE